ncbi:hypothetical protein [Streptomyces boncukensis]|uniref:Uncharacterized protein n=1 Tax=Streptomyces boncukensis TaxID=2711219 RepID=A0A6G4XAU0_9ACTN|nr:hypothetical protein [Streptomyces boncukensis]NGO73771.1 hypothetical protein [Streptomyces boncukensis]
MTLWTLASLATLCLAAGIGALHHGRLVTAAVAIGAALGTLGQLCWWGLR